MNFPLLVAKRYLFAAKSHTAINIISVISWLGVVIGTMALILVLSAMNGIDDLMSSLYGKFDPDLQVKSSTANRFPSDSLQLRQIASIEGVASVSEILEETVLLSYQNKQHLAVIRGIPANYTETTRITESLVRGHIDFGSSGNPGAILGAGVQYFLSVPVPSTGPIEVFSLPKDTRISSFADNTLRGKPLWPTAVFSVDEETNAKYLLAPLSFVQSLLQEPSAISAIDIHLYDDADIGAVRKSIDGIVGSTMKVRNQKEQKESFYKISKMEKWAAFFILLFILLIASFNVVASLSMLIIEKKNDIGVLENMGASDDMIIRIFLYEGWLISGLGSLAGMLLGALLCWLQMEYGWLKIAGSGSFVFEAYPVSLRASDFLMVFAASLLIGLVTAYIPAKTIVPKYLNPEGSCKPKNP